MLDKFMSLALREAQKAFDAGEVPVGCVIVHEGKIISKAHNEREKRQSAISHAEVLCIERACKKLNSFRLDDCEMYLTLEPCAMCSGAIINARLKTLYYGASDKNYGCAKSRYNLLSDKNFEHTVEIVQGIMEEECSSLLQDFFKKVREKNKAKCYLDKNINFTLLDTKNMSKILDNKKINKLPNFDKIDVKTAKNSKKTQNLPYFLIKINNFVAKAFLNNIKKNSGKVSIILEELGSYNVYLLIDFLESEVETILSLFPQGTNFKIITKEKKSIYKVK